MTSSSGRSWVPACCPAGEVEKLQDDEAVRVAGWPVARQHPHGRDGTVFVTIEDETGDVQVIVWRDLFARRRRELGSQVVEVTGRVSRWDGNYERHRDGPSRHPFGRRHAAIARLALRSVAAIGDCAKASNRFMMEVTCVADTA